jgi:hypothetical protein
MKTILALILASFTSISAFASAQDIYDAKYSLMQSLSSEPKVKSVVIDHCDGITGASATAFTVYKVSCLLIWTTDDQVTERLRTQFPEGSMYQSYFVNVFTWQWKEL